ncbi:MAG TPA: hypothetical protein VGK89_00245 [Candidatus Eisenbacteria bacterium]|jgi:hypothetical protein
MKLLNPELQKLEQRVAPDLGIGIGIGIGFGSGSGSCSGSDSSG